MKGILLDDQEELDILIKKNGLGIIISGLRVGACEGEIAERVLRANRGEFKEVPLIGGEIDRMINGLSDVFYIGRLKDMLMAMRINTGKIFKTDTGINIEIVSDERI
ncbi:MAG: hypothetical protein RSA53_05540 [Odoribacter sp.]